MQTLSLSLSCTQLHVAAANGYMEVLDFLFSQEGLDLNIADNEGWTPFHAAVCWGQKEAMKMLAQKGVDMDAKDLHGDTAYGIDILSGELLLPNVVMESKKV